MALINKLGRKPRKFSPRIMHLSAIRGAMKMIAPPPAAVDWTKGITDFGMMLNDTLGDCTCAAAFHARQIWTANTGSEDTQPDAEVLALYEAACGYVPGDSSTDQGGVEQDVLTYLLKTGYPLQGGAVEKIVGFMEVDPRNLNDVKTVINECGLIYIGFDVPDSINEDPGSTWDVVDGSSIEGGHAVIIAGYRDGLFIVISWGKIYYMTEAFFLKYVDESYAIGDPNWFKNGQTPLGLTQEQWQDTVKAVTE